jgi:hypothetical protein
MPAVRRRTITLRWFPPVGGPRKRRPGALAASSEGHLRMTDWGLGVMLCSPRQGRFGRRPARRDPGGEVSVFGVPFRPRPAHIVQVGPIRTAGSTAFAETLPQPADGFNEISQHQTLPLPLHEGSSWAVASSERLFHFQTSVSYECSRNNLKKWCDCGRRRRSTLKIVEELVAVVTARAEPRPTLCQRAEIMSGMPPSGRSVTRATGLGLWPASGAKRKHRTKVARTTAASMVANPAPMQMRGPPPNGRNE